MKALYISMLLLFSGTIYSQADLWSTDDGLSNEWISDIVQDEDGYIWLATQYGLNRFDGYDFVVYNSQPSNDQSLNANWVRNLQVSNSGALYISCFLGLIQRFDANEKRFVTLKHSAGESYPSIVRDLHIDESDDLWVGASEGLYRLNSETETLTLVHKLDVKDISDAPDGGLYIVAKDAIYLVKGEHSYKEVALTSDLNINQLFVDHHNELWAINDLGLCRVDTISWTLSPFTLDDYSPSGVFNQTSVREDNKGRLWVAGERGINVISTDRKNVIYILWAELIKKDIQPIIITKIFQDRDDNIWIGTNKGLIMTSDLHRRFQENNQYNFIRDLKGVRAIHVHDQITWLGNEEALYEIRSSNQDQVERKIFDQIVTSIHLSKSGSLYIGSHDGVYVRKDGNTEFDKIKGNFIWGTTWDILEDHQGYLWFASLYGLYRYDPRSTDLIKFTSDDHPYLKSNIAIHLTLDHEGQLWGGSLNDGVYHLTNTYTFTTVESAIFSNYRLESDAPNSLSSNLIQAMTTSPDGTIWVGTDAGLNRIYKSGEVKQYLKKDGLIDDKFMSLHVDDAGILWGSTIGHGVMAMNIENDEFQYFNKEDGLCSNNFLLNSGYLTESGLLLLGTDSETQIINTTKVLDIDKYHSDFSFTDIVYLTGEKSRDLMSLDEVSIPFNQNSFNISFSTLQFFKAEQTKYKYRILPNQTEWQNNGSSRMINFNGLSTGQYELEVKASNPRLDLSPEIIKLSIYILPPWWRTWWAYLIYALFGMGVAYYFIEKQKERNEANKTRELNNLKNKLYTNITHEIRTPLTVMLGLSQRLMRESKKSVASNAEIIHRNGNHLLLLANRILDLAKIESGKLTVHLEQKNIAAYLSYLLESFHSLAEEKDIRLHFLPSEDDFNVDYDSELMKQIINNLISNAIKFTPVGGNVYCELSVEGGHYIIKVRDTGSGIPEASVVHIFDRFYQGEVSRNGSGIGLALTKELVQLLDGQLSVTNNPVKGCTFKVALPISNNASIGDDLPSTGNNNELSLFSKDLDQILIIEDHKDVSDFISSAFSGRFKILQAFNGKDGLKLAAEYVPDIIISDVMMPGLTGYEVCKRLKSNEQTNHIPIILLTAKADQASKIEGLISGADDYLIKPFDMEEIDLKVMNLLASRKTLQARYQDALSSDELLDIEMIDPFIKNVITLIDGSISDASYGIARLCRDLGISRVHLHRKLKALTNESTAVFIRNIRLTRAKAMLVDSDMNVSEVAYDVGFNDPSYFSKLFSERFGISPTKAKQESVYVTSK